MNALQKNLAPLQEDDVAKELERLFALQDRPLSNDKKSLIVKELSYTGIPCAAIIAGIQELCDQDLKQIKFSIIKSAAQSKMTKRGEDTTDRCSLCGFIGFIVARSPAGHTIAYPCTCRRGGEFARNQGLVPWNGKRTLVSARYGLVTMIHPDPEKHNIPQMSDEEYEATSRGNQTHGETAWTE